MMTDEGEAAISASWMSPPGRYASGSFPVEGGGGRGEKGVEKRRRELRREERRRVEVKEKREEDRCEKRRGGERE